MNAAANLDLNHRAFRQCVTNLNYDQTLEHNEHVVKAAGVQGTPTLIVSGLAYSNPSTATVVEVIGE